MEPKNNRRQILVALVALIGTLGAAVFSNWDKIFSPRKPVESKVPHQVSSGTASPNIGSVQGDVQINVNNAPTPVKIPTFAAEEATVSQIDELEKFVEANRGKLVRISISVPSQQSRIINGNPKFFELSSFQCDSQNFAGCRTSALILDGDDYELGWYKGNNMLRGYFVVDDSVEMHQGPYYGLKAIPRETVLLQTQR